MWMAPKGSGGDQECIFFTLNTYQPTFISDITDIHSDSNYSLVRGRPHMISDFWVGR